MEVNNFEKLDSNLIQKYSNITATTGEVITENTTPNLDDWGWDDFWDCQDWIEWHKIMKQKKGKQYADSKFLEWWNKQGFGAHALDCRSFNSNFKDYFKSENLYNALYDGIGVVAQPIGAATDVVQAGSNAVSNSAQAIENTSKTLKIAIPIVVIGTLIIGGIWAYNKFAK